MVIPSEMIRFPGVSNDLLAARLDRPAGTPCAYALFAHCFTCSKDSLAATRISRALTAHGIAVLRFDFTGPYDLLVAGLGACTAMTIRMYADLKQLPLGRVTVRLKHDKIHARDCAECETRDGKNRQNRA